MMKYKEEESEDCDNDDRDNDDSEGSSNGSTDYHSDDKSYRFPRYGRVVSVGDLVGLGACGFEDAAFGSSYQYIGFDAAGGHEVLIEANEWKDVLSSLDYNVNHFGGGSGNGGGLS